EKEQIYVTEVYLEREQQQQKGRCGYGATYRWQKGPLLVPWYPSPAWCARVSGDPRMGDRADGSIGRTGVYCRDSPRPDRGEGRPGLGSPGPSAVGEAVRAESQRRGKFPL